MNKTNILSNSYYIWWKNIDKIILTLIGILIFLGIFFFSFNIINCFYKLGTNSYYFFFGHLIFILMGITLILFFSVINESYLYRISLILFFIFFVSLILVQFFGVEVKGSKRWLDVTLLPRFQPIEFLKPFFIVIISFIITYKNNTYNYLNFFLSFLLISPIIFLLIMQPDIGQTILISLVWLVIIFVSGINFFIFNFFILVAASSLISLIYFIPKFSYIKNRLISFVDASPRGNYQSEKASEAIINGGFFEKGIGRRYFKRKSSRSTYRLCHISYIRRVWNYFYNFYYVNIFSFSF